MIECLHFDKIYVGRFDSHCYYPVTKKPLESSVSQGQYVIEYMVKAPSRIWVNGKEYTVSDGCVQMFRGGDKKAFVGEYMCYYMHIYTDPDKVCDSFDNIFLKIPPVYRPYNSAQILNLMKKYCESLNPISDISGNVERLSPVGMYAAAYTMVDEIARDYEKKGMKLGKFSKNIGEIEKTIAYMTEHYDEHITVEELAQMTYISASHYYKVFNGVTGRSPMDYLTDVRVEKARELLVMTNFSIADIAAKCGFESPAYFSYVYRKNKGYPPIKERKR